MNQPKSLDVFQELTLRATNNDRSALRKSLISHARPPWRHAKAEENRLLRLVGDARDFIAFERKASDGLQSASLVLRSSDEGYQVLNIVPLEEGQLGYRSYNAILQDFSTRIAKPASQTTGSEPSITNPTETLDNWLPPSAAHALRQFSSAANRGTGSGHPLDRERWLTFLIEAYKAKPLLSTDRLARWLTEIDGWPSEKAHELVVQYEFGLELLARYDQEGQ